jgi:hypothetical protein
VTLLDPGPTRRTVPAGVITGPANPDNFRVQVGNFGDRWYIDNLDADDTWPTFDGELPSYSTVKKASGQDWSFVAMKRVAAADTDRLAMLDPEHRLATLNAINKQGLEDAAGRGTIVHWWFEDLLDGRPMRTFDPDHLPHRITRAAHAEALTYQDAVADLVRTYKPKLIAAEYVAIHRTLNGWGYGCTPDALVEWDGEIVGIDYKSRGEESKHGCYPEEGAQIAAGVFADYMIVDDGNGGARRQPIPKVHHGLVVSVKPDGCRLYPIDLDVAWEHYTKMHAWWVARRTERAHIGRVLPVKKSTVEPEPAPPPTLGELRAMWATPDEGPDVSKILVEAAKNSYDALGDDKAFVNAIATEAKRNGVPIGLKERPTLRRFEIMRGLIRLAGADCDDEDVRLCVATAMDSDAPLMPAVAVGWAVGAMSAAAAAAFARIADDHVDGRLMVVDDRLVAVGVA